MVETEAGLTVEDLIKNICQTLLTFPSQDGQQPNTPSPSAQYTTVCRIRKQSGDISSFLCRAEDSEDLVDRSCDDRLANNSLSLIYHRENLFAAFLVSEPPELEIRFSQIY